MALGGLLLMTFLFHRNVKGSLLLGIADVAGKYYVPSLGAFVIYTVMIVVLVFRPQGLFVKSR